MGCSSWQLPRPEADLSQPRMSSDVGASRIWNRLLDAAFDNSDRRKHGMGIVGRKCIEITENTQMLGVESKDHTIPRVSNFNEESDFQGY